MMKQINIVLYYCKNNKLDKRSPVAQVLKLPVSHQLIAYRELSAHDHS